MQQAEEYSESANTNNNAIESAMDTQKDIMEQEARGTGSIVSKDDKLPDSKLTGENLPSSVPEA